MRLTTPEPIRCSPNLMPVVGVAFQVAIFVLLALTFAVRGQDESSRLPGSELARPPAARYEPLVELQVTSQGTALLGAVEVPMAEVRASLERERDAIRLRGMQPAQAKVVLRADRDVPTGVVQELMEVGQQVGFEQFVLRAQETGGPEP